MSTFMFICIAALLALFIAWIVNALVGWMSGEHPSDRSASWRHFLSHPRRCSSWHVGQISRPRWLAAVGAVDHLHRGRSVHSLGSHARMFTRISTIPPEQEPKGAEMAQFNGSITPPLLVHHRRRFLRRHDGYTAKS
jgi:hypothetical protein